MKGFCESHNVDMVCVMLTNIIDESSELIYEGEEAAELLGKAFHVPAENGAIYLPGCSIKKKTAYTFRNGCFTGIKILS